MVAADMMNTLLSYFFKYFLKMFSERNTKKLKSLRKYHLISIDTNALHESISRTCRPKEKAWHNILSIGTLDADL